MSRRIFLIGNAHLDICWLWDFEEGFQEVRATFWSAIHRIKEYGTHVFSSASSLHYELVKKTDPVLFSEIGKAIADGRWHVVGGWYLQPDCNAPAGESFVRQGLYGQKFFKENFGVRATTGYNVDSFGHNANLPQILKLQGMDSYVFMRPDVVETDTAKRFVFRWHGVDGTEITTSRVPISYTAVDQWGTGLKVKVPQVLEMAEKEGMPLMCFYGIGDHGGGPTKENIEFLQNLIDSQEDPEEIQFSTTREFFDYVAGLPMETYSGELQHHAIGCYSLMADIKHLNARCEHELMRAERLNYLLRHLSDGNAAGFLEENWKRVLFNQFHDILGGCCASFVYDGVRNRYGHVLDEVRDYTGTLIQKLGSRLDTSDGVMKLLVVNTLPWKVRETVDLNSLIDSITDIDGKEIPFQLVKAEPTANLFAYHARVNLELPAFGWKVWKLYGVTPMASPDLLVQNGVERTADRSISNDLFSVHFNREDNSIGPVFHKGKEVIRSIRPVVIDDDSDAWSHTLVRYDGMRTYLPIEKVNVYTSGDVSKEYEVVYSYGNSSLKLRVRLNAGSDRVEFDSDIFWSEQQKMLKLVFETESESDTFMSEIPYGAIERASNGEEWPCQRWIAKKSNGLYVGILNDGVYSSSSDADTLEYGVLRSPGAAHHYPANLSRTTFHTFTDQGTHKARFAIVCGEDCSGFSKQAIEFNQKPFVLIESIHEGDLPDVSEHDMDIPGCVVTTIKPAESGNGYVFRINDVTGRKHEEDVCIDGHRMTLNFHGYEIKSLYLDLCQGSIEEVDLLEDLKGK